MFSRKEVFENYLGKLGLNKTVFEAVKDINGVLFEGIDDELDEFDDDVPETPSESAPPIDIASVAENIDEETNAPKDGLVVPDADIAPDAENHSTELSYLKPVPFHTAYQEALAWARREPRFDDLWNNYRGIDSVSFMIPSSEGNKYYNENTGGE